jgi:TRAP-type C4-dicarboxylate transport system permease small subunit
LTSRDTTGARLADAYTGACAALSKVALALAILGLLALILCVQYQVVGRYVFNDTPTWAEALALLLVLFVTAFGVAVGVRDAGHIGLESLIVLLPVRLRVRVEMLVHALVATFGVLMVHSAWRWATLKWGERKPMLGVPEGLDYVPLVIAGTLIVLFSLEHIVALLRGRTVEPAWS